jgi:hypothetical protein
MDEPNKIDVNYNTMPQEGKAYRIPSDAPSGGKKWFYIIVAVIVLLAAGGGLYYMLGGKIKTESQQQTPASRLSKGWLNTYFNVDTCVDQTKCSETADPEKDGLKNYDEFVAKTNPLNPDTDTDGIADGDEVNIYKTDPAEKYTDSRPDVRLNDWSDGFQIKGGYDPLTPGQKFTELRADQILASIDEFQMHEPTFTTLREGIASAIPADWKTYNNSNHKFEIKYPSDWTVAEFTAPSERVTFASDKIQGQSVIGEIVINFNKMTPCPLSTNVTMQVGEVTIYKNSTDDSKLTAACILEESGRIEFGLSAASSRIPHAIPVLNQILPTFKFTK